MVAAADCDTHLEEAKIEILMDLLKDDWVIERDDLAKSRHISQERAVTHTVTTQFRIILERLSKAPAPRPACLLRLVTRRRQRLAKHGEAF